jgi:AraC-like DNA-binding protein
MRRGILREYDPKPGCSVSSLSYEYPRGFCVPQHAHASDQLIYAIRGLMEVSASRKLWLIPPHLAIWIPARTWHRIRMPNRASMRTLYFRVGIVRRSPACAVLHVSSLLRELVLEAVRSKELRASNALHRSLRDLIAAQLRSAPEIPVSVMLPTDPRALRFAQNLMPRLENSTLLTDACRIAGASVRTMERIFQREVGMSLESWRRQVRLMKSVELLVEGCPVKEVAAEVGYRQPSAFIELFRQTLGVTPKAWTSAALGKSEA